MGEMEPFLLKANQKTQPREGEPDRTMIAKVKECIYPENTDCRGCSHSYNPALYDGGCKLFYEGVGASKSLQHTRAETVEQSHAQNRKIKSEKRNFSESPAFSL